MKIEKTRYISLLIKNIKALKSILKCWFLLKNQGKSIIDIKTQKCYNTSTLIYINVLTLANNFERRNSLVANASNSNDTYYDSENMVYVGEDGNWYSDEECTEPAGD